MNYFILTVFMKRYFHPFAQARINLPFTFQNIPDFIYL